MTKKFYTSPPATCNVCTDPFKDGDMYDARATDGRWGNFCTRHWQGLTSGRLGLGYGQKYTRQADGQFLKVKG